MTTRAMTVGSLRDIATRNGYTIAESFLSADVIVIVDVSSSMDGRDAGGGRSRYERACSELARVQADAPGKIAVVSFSNDAKFVAGGIPPMDYGSTNLAAALRFVQPADGCVRFIVISDGEPNSQSAALDVASSFTSKIDTIYVGPESGEGRAFLRQLAAASGGVTATSFRTEDLAKTVTLLLKVG